ncbi:MAG: bifunctional methylenetetrahydrofolate dehydrogenase/methenyltetrahydrofolate cyclohydrolase FolD [Rubricoccaceae bacterium]
MPARLIDGTALAADVRADTARAAAAFAARAGRRPGLRVVLVGEHPASASYVRAKQRAAEEAGFDAATLRLPETTSEAELLALVGALNEDEAVDGILVQLPLPSHVAEARVLQAIAPEKDVDGFHPVNVGRLVVGDARALAPCTPAGIMEMLRRAGVETAGAHAVVIGRSNIVGKPMATLLTAAHATVTVCHSRTRDLAAHTRRADLLVAAIGRACFVTADMVRPGATVIDVGINRVEDAAHARGYRLVGDVDFEGVRGVAGAVTPVPGGVGPMTIAMLLANTLRAAETRAAETRAAETRAAETRAAETRAAGMRRPA